MNGQEIIDRVVKIEAMSFDAEMAHVEEDQLYADFIRHVQDEAGTELSEMARLVLTTSEIEFPRWCA